MFRMSSSRLVASLGICICTYSEDHCRYQIPEESAQEALLADHIVLAHRRRNHLRDCSRSSHRNSSSSSIRPSEVFGECGELRASRTHLAHRSRYFLDSLASSQVSRNCIVAFISVRVVACAVCNIGIIIRNGRVLYPILGLPGIGIGVVLGAIAHVSIHLPIVAKARDVPEARHVPVAESHVGQCRERLSTALNGARHELGYDACAASPSRAVSGTGSMSIFTLANNLESRSAFACLPRPYATAAFPMMADHTLNKKQLR